MAQKLWRVGAGLHSGGREDDDHVDANSHITVSFGRKRSVHLQLASSGFLRNVTEDGSDLGVEQMAPWPPPGAPTEQRVKRRP
jgi:hypothetical protein